MFSLWGPVQGWLSLPVGLSGPEKLLCLGQTLASVSTLGSGCHPVPVCSTPTSVWGACSQRQRSRSSIFGILWLGKILQKNLSRFLHSTFPLPHSLTQGTFIKHLVCASPVYSRGRNSVTHKTWALTGSKDSHSV